MKKYIKTDKNHPFSIKPCSMSYEYDDDNFEIIYNGLDFEIVPIDKSKKELNHIFDSLNYEAGEWEKDWLTDWDDDDWNRPEKESNEKKCNHEWKPTRLFFSVVYDCVKCGAKKEENK